MKKLLLTITIALSHFVNAQQFFGLPTQNASWVESYYSVDNYETGSVVYLGDKKYFVNGDTTLNGTLYYKIYKNAYGQIELSHFFRNDTITKQVKCRFLNENSEHILLDFNINVNDTISDVVLGYYDVNIQNNKLIVKEIDSIFIDNQYYKRVKLSNIYSLSNQLYYVVWIDGFGNLSSGGMLGSTGLFSYTPKFISCFEQNNQYYSAEPFHNTGYVFYNDSISLTNNCSFNPLNVDKISEVNFNVYPNPFKDYLILEFPNSNEKKVIIYSLKGAIIIEKTNIQDKSLKINLSAYNKGVYFLKIIEGKSVFTQKIIKL